MADSAPKHERRIRLGLLALIVFGVVMTLTLNGIGVIYLVQGAEPAKESRDAQLRALRVLVECTTAPAQRVPPEPHPAPDDCYLRQQASQTLVIGEPKGPINTVTVAAAACGAAHPGDVPATLACTRRAVGSGEP